MEFEIPSLNILLVLPVVIVIITGALLMFIDMFVAEDKKLWAPILSAAGLVLAFVQNWGLWGSSWGTFTPVGGHPMIVVDNFATFLNFIFLLTGLLSILISHNSLRRTGLNRPEYYMLMLISISGMMLMGMANDLILIFLALELLSIPLYIMSGFAWRSRVESEESAMKYFFLGAFSSGILVFGIALTYGAAVGAHLHLLVATP
jgi:NADH-quinone oxidoreductase subunit N